MVAHGKKLFKVSGKKLKIFAKRLICPQGDIVNYFTNIGNVFFYFEISTSVGWVINGTNKTEKIVLGVSSINIGGAKSK